MVNTEKEKTMLTTLVNLLKKIFPGTDPHSCLEQYLISKNIQTAGEADYWQRRFETRQHKRWL
jgi:hypothetical protein